MADTRLFERFKSWGWMTMIVTIIAFLVVMGLSLVFGLGINGTTTLPIISLALIGLAIVFVGGFAIQIYGSTRIWLRRRRASSQTPARRPAKRTQIERGASETPSEG